MERIQIGPCVASLAVRGKSLSDLAWRAFSHLRVEPTHSPEPDLSIFLRESEGRGTPSLQELEHALPRTWEGYDLTIRSSLDGRYVCHRMDGEILCLDRKKKIAFGVLESRRLKLFQRSKPLLVLLRLCLHDLSLQVVHAGMVAREDRGALIMGPQAAGKSTVAVTCMLGGLDFLGDDQIVLEQKETEFRGHSLYNSFHMDPTWLGKVGDFPSGSIDSTSQGKAAIYLYEAMPERIRLSAPVKAIVLPRTGASRTAVRKASSGEALRQLAPSSLLLPLGAGRAGFVGLASLVEAVPAYWLEMGPDLEEIPAYIQALLGNLSGRAGPPALSG